MKLCLQLCPWARLHHDFKDATLLDLLLILTGLEHRRINGQGICGFQAVVLRGFLCHGAKDNMKYEVVERTSVEIQTPMLSVSGYLIIKGLLIMSERKEYGKESSTKAFFSQNASILADMVAIWIACCAIAIERCFSY